MVNNIKSEIIVAAIIVQLPNFKDRGQTCDGASKRKKSGIASK